MNARNSLSVEENILIVPKPLANSAFQLLTECQAVPRSYQLEGRYGSRMRPVDETSIGIPLSPHLDWTQCKEIRHILQKPGVRVSRTPFVPSRRVQDRPSVDARIHRERAPLNYQNVRREEAANGVSSREEAAFTYAELFAGIGGFGVALEALGGKCVFCSEWEEACQAVYRQNFPGIPIHGDIRAVPNEALPAELDLLVGGFPCQPFSTLGKQPGLACEKQGQLIYEVARVLRVSKPKAFLLENVPGLQSMTETFDIVLEVLKDAGYSVHTEICSSRGLTATNRKRLFFFGFRINKVEKVAEKAQPLFEVPFVPDLKIRAAHVLDYDDVPEDSLELFRLTPKTFTQLLNCNRWAPSKLAWPDGVCNSLTGHYGNSVGRGESQLVPGCAPNPPRRYSPRECARLMGFPSTFQLGVLREKQGDMAFCKEQYRMFGNAVCPPLIAALTGAVLARIQRDEKWVSVGRARAVQLAWAATRSGPSSSITMATVPSKFFANVINEPF